MSKPNYTAVPGPGIAIALNDEERECEFAVAEGGVTNAMLAADVGGTVDSVVAGANVSVDATDPANPIVSAEAGGIVDSVVAGANVSVDATDPANPIVSAEAGGTVDSVVAGANVSVDATDPANPIVSAEAGGTVDSVVAGANVSVDATDPANPIVSAEAGGIVDSVVAGANVSVDATDPANPIVSAEAGGTVDSVVAGANVYVDATDPANPIVSAPSRLSQTLADKFLAPDPTVGDGADTGLAITEAPAGLGLVDVRYNGRSLSVANGDGQRATSCFYYSNDDGATALAFGAIPAGAGLFFNGSVGGFNLAPEDTISQFYEEEI